MNNELGDLIFDWNLQTGPEIPSGRKVTLDDETLRDGLQNPSVFDPPIGEKIEILHLMESLGIEMVNIGLPGAGPRAYADTEALAKEIAKSRMNIRPNCAARTVEADIRPIAEISQKAGIATCVFDRGGYLYHGRVKALADGAREGGLSF